MFTTLVTYPFFKIVLVTYLPSLKLYYVGYYIPQHYLFELVYTVNGHECFIYMLNYLQIMSVFLESNHNNDYNAYWL